MAFEIESEEVAFIAPLPKIVCVHDLRKWAFFKKEEGFIGVCLICAGHEDTHALPPGFVKANALCYKFSQAALEEQGYSENGMETANDYKAYVVDVKSAERADR